MKTNTENPLKSVGDFFIGMGGVFCLITVLLFGLSVAGGNGNGLILFGGGTLGLLMVMAGYLKRISATLIASAEAKTRRSAASEVN